MNPPGDTTRTPATPAGSARPARPDAPETETATTPDEHAATPTAAATPGWSARVTDWIRRHDPAGLARRNALIGFVLSTAVTAIAVATGTGELWLNDAFLGILLLLMANVAGPRRRRVVAAYIGACALGFVAIIGLITGPIPFVVPLLTAGIAFCAVMIQVWTPFAAAIGTVATMTFCIFAGMPEVTYQERLTHATVFFAAALSAATAVSLWRDRGKPDLPGPIAAALHALADGLDAVIDDPDAYVHERPKVLAATTSMETRAATSARPPFGPTHLDRARYRVIHDIQLSTANFDLTRRLGRHDELPDEIRTELDSLRRRLAAVWRDLATAVEDASHEVNRGEIRLLDEHSRRFHDRLTDAAAASPGDPVAFLAIRWARPMRTGAQLAARMCDAISWSELHGSVRRPRPVWEAATTITAGGWWARIRANLHPDAPVFRQALRLGVATFIAAAIVRLADIPHGAWAPLTVVVVSRSTLGASWHMSWKRVVGATAGGVAIVGILSVTGTSRDVLVPLAILLLACTYLFAVFGPDWLAGWIAMFLVCNTLLGEPANSAIPANYWIGMTLLGAGVSLVVSSLMWRRGTGPSLHRIEQHLRTAMRRHLRAVLASGAGEPDPAGERLRRNAAEALIRFRASVAGAASEGTPEIAAWSYLLTTNERIATVVALLDSFLVGNGRHRQPPAMESVIAAARATLPGDEDPAAAAVPTAGTEFWEQQWASIPTETTVEDLAAAAEQLSAFASIDNLAADASARVPLAAGSTGTTPT